MNAFVHGDPEENARHLALGPDEAEDRPTRSLSAYEKAFCAVVANLQSKGLAMTAAILSLLPCGGCCCIGLPFGIDRGGARRLRLGRRPRPQAVLRPLRPDSARSSRNADDPVLRSGECPSGAQAPRHPTPWQRRSAVELKPVTLGTRSNFRLLIVARRLCR